MINVFRANLWPPSTSHWAVFFALMAILIGVLVPWRRGRVLMSATILAAIALVCVVLVRTDAAPALLMLAWLTAASAVLGNLGLQVSGLENGGALLKLERVALSALLGFGFLSVIAGCLASFGALSRVTAFVLLVAGSLPALRHGGTVLPALRSCSAEIAAQWKKRDLRWTAYAAAALGLCAAFPFTWALVPSVHWDALAAHLPVGLAYASPRGFAAVADFWFSYAPSQVHVLYALAFALVGQPLPGLLHFTFGVLTTSLLFSLALRLAGLEAAWVAVLAFVTMPVVAWEAGTAYIDLFVVGYTFGSIYAILRWRDTRSPGWLPVAGVLGGLAIGCKANAAAMLAAPLLYVLITVVRRRQTKSMAHYLIGCVAPLLLIPAPWFIRNWVWSGNPFYPMSWSWFHSSQPPVAFNWQNFGLGQGPLYFLRLPLDMVIKGAAFDEHGLFPFGLVPLAVAASLLFGHKQVPWRLRGLLAFFVVSATLLWFRVGQVGRYLLPIVPLAIVLAVLPLSSILRFFTDRRACWLFSVFGCLGLLYVAYTRSISTVWNYNLTEGYPYRYLLGLESRAQFLDRALPVCSALQYINTHKTPSSRIFSPTSQIRFYVDVTLDDPVYNRHTLSLMQLPAGDSLVREIRKRGYDYILLDHARITPGLMRIPYLDQNFLKRFADLEYTGKNVYLYRIRGKERHEPAPTRELLINGNFGEVSGDKTPVGWGNFGWPRMTVLPLQAHSPPGFVEVTQQDGWYQRVTAKPGILYTVSLWARANVANQSVWLQVLWFDSAIKMLDTGITQLPVTSKWHRYRASFTAPATKTAFVQVYARAAPGSTVFVDDISLVEGW